MKNLYYFSKNKLQYVEIRNFYKKFLFLILFFSVSISFLVFGLYYVYAEYVTPDAEMSYLKSTNSELKAKLSSIIEKFEDFDTEMYDLSEKNNLLRLENNLDPLDIEEEKVGTGGSIFEDITPGNSAEVNELLSKIDTYIKRMNVKINAEKKNFEEIENAIKVNAQLYDAIPAIVPCEGNMKINSFGMRLHPILKIRRMHNGIDIVNNIGTNIYAPGGGKVSFAGRRGGLGLTLEIEHGFGYKTIYGHLSGIKVKAGQKVKRGDLVALSGNSGKLTTGPHLHYEVRHNGIPLDPHNFMYEDVNLFEVVNRN